MPKKPSDAPPAPPEDPVDADHFDELGEDELPDDFDLEDLEPVFTEEAPIPVLDDEDGEDGEVENLAALPEDAELGREAPLEIEDDGEADDFDLAEEPFRDDVDWTELTEDAPGLLPMLDWHQEVYVEELGRTLTAELDPTSESTTWFRPDVSRAAHRLTFTLGGETVSPFPSLVRSRRERLRIGRDVLSGRFLVRC
ncbi:MAG: hypothetical protein EP330_24045 [Deltaproteobacteria bacterium]|nr:MAG: hypothetical protein EP330_24045 [Deltaproteobacteria bacterium]